MDWLERHLTIFPKPGLMMVIGAGQGRELPILTRCAGKRLVLIEPQPRLASGLQQMTEGLPGAEVLECALDDTSGTAMLKVFNFPELSSLRPDESLATLLPGARQTAELPVKTRTLAVLVQQLEVEPNPNNWLIVDVLGVDASVLAGLQDRDLRRCFGHVVLRTWRQGHPDGGIDIKSLRESFQELGYQSLGSEDLSDGDWPRVHLQYFGSVPKRKEPETTVDALKVRSRNLDQACRDLQGQQGQKTKDFEGKVTEFDQQLRDVTEDAEQRRAVFGADLEAGKQALDVSNPLQVQQVDELTTALEAKSKEASTLERKLRARCERLGYELEKARSDLSVSLRMQALRTADLKDMQERYAEVTELKDQQHELLVKLRQRLGAASDYLNQLQGTDEATGKSGAAEGLARAVSGDLESAG